MKEPPPSGQQVGGTRRSGMFSCFEICFQQLFFCVANNKKIEITKSRLHC